MEGYKGEVRRVHVLYFLSRNGTIEQPHLIRVHHLHRSGVYLRDVKRWLADLRGKDMPDSFCWSYKRRYKSGYVWQDLMDDELITPISDNEYVLKGSELSSKTDLCLGEDEENQSPVSKTCSEMLHIEIDKSVSPNLLPGPDQESPGALAPPPLSGSEASDDSAKRASIIKTDLWKQESEQNKDEEKQEYETKESSRNESRGNRLHSPSGRSGHRTSPLFRNLFRCGVAETKDKALMTVPRQERYQAVSGGSYKRAGGPCKRAAVGDVFRDEKTSNQRSVATDSR